MSVDQAGSRRANERDYWIEHLQEKGGFTVQQARVLASLPNVDLHTVLEHVTKRGCDPDTCFDIYS